MSDLLSLFAAGVLLFGGPSSVPARQEPAEPPSLEAVEPPVWFEVSWVAAHSPTMLWTGPSEWDVPTGAVHPWAVFRVDGPQQGDRLHVWDPRSGEHAWVDAGDVGPIDPNLAGTEHLPPITARAIWVGQARVTMYTCVELGGCAPTASGIWPEPGVVAVDPRLIPLGATVWIEGLGTFLAADTGSAVKGAHLDVFSTSYPEAIAWGVQSLPIIVFE